MANLAVFIELRDGRPTAPSRQALAETRRIAGVLGATVYAVATTADTDPAFPDALATELGGGGADRVFLCVDPALAGPPLEASHGHLLRVVASRLRPRLFVFPGGGLAAELGAPLAARLRAIWIPSSTLELMRPEAPDGQILLRAHVGRAAAKLDLGKVSGTVVLSLASGPPAGAPGGAAAEIDQLTFPTTAGPQVRELAARPDDALPIATATTLVLAPGLAGENRELDEDTVVLTDPVGVARATSLACPSRLVVVSDGRNTRLVEARLAALSAPATRVAWVQSKRPPAETKGLIDVVLKADAAEILPKLATALKGGGAKPS